MTLSRRTALVATASTALATLARPSFTHMAFTNTAAAQTAIQDAPASDARTTERGLGEPGAKVVVNEWFSLTCTHCAEFQKTTFPRIRKELIDTGRIRYVWRDYPLDQVALTAAMVARALPADRYEPFISTLLLTQDRWAFTRGVNTTDELAKLAALAGMPRATFNDTIADAGLKQAILQAQDQAEQKLSITSTPSFVINGKVTAGAVGYPAFQALVDAQS